LGSGCVLFSAPAWAFCAWLLTLSAGGSSRFSCCAIGCCAAVFDAPVAAAAAAAATGLLVEGLIVDGLVGGLEAFGGGGGLEGRDDCA
jgi:hypothetical protein